ncbi:MAG: LuxR C-terminal-related transcriptional regulator [Sphingobium sp.]|jgi:DNA-binding CsgD family transcriptional regulator|nr:LuxR C-terminal-related transcriptional regulator [Sphingobium sp.]MCI1270884.1 LuxR C-terminal-related transcriptional regulator [Sphingobium sp.]MCI1755781.1 LuxR C-terminal-related transcriptional regulator [Sphingobium sp.]MCI2053085.1 LuxR C-terminal-related transcriptional regulator [Sphingobium sp.]
MRPRQTLPLLDAEASARLIGASSADEFAAALLEIARSIADVEELFGYMVVDEQEPRVLISRSLLPGVEQRVDMYVRRFYRHDPAVHANRAIATGKSFVQRISLASIIPHDYRTHCFVEPGFSEKLSFGWRGARYLLVVSFYGTDAQDSDALARLANLASMTLAVLVRQYAPIDTGDAAEVVEARLLRSFPTLSEREAQICARTILGRSAAEIAQELCVLPGTILTYRQRAYQKTGVSAAGALVPMILN